MNRDKLLFIDTETMGLDPVNHPIWEVSWAVWDLDLAEWCISTRQLLHDSSQADPVALEINGWRERFNPANAVMPEEFIEEFGRVAHGRHLIGLVPSFDEERLRAMWWQLTSGVDRQPWHYHIIDLEAVVIGWLAYEGTDVPLPWRSDDVSKAVGVDAGMFARHSSEGDVMWAIDLFEATLGTLDPAPVPS